MTTQSIFAPGNTVQVIDPEEITSEWATFTIIAQELNQYLLKPTNKSTYDEPLWVLPEEICPTTLTPSLGCRG